MKKLLLWLCFMLPLFSISQSFMVPVNLQLDLNTTEIPGDNINVFFSSNLTSWSSVQMYDYDNDGIYEGTINVGASAGQETQFLYIFQILHTFTNTNKRIRRLILFYMTIFYASTFCFC